MKILITGTAGFIGFHTAVKFLREGHQVTGIDNINEYYQVDLKYDRLKASGIKREDAMSGNMAQSGVWPDYRFIRIDLQDDAALEQLFRNGAFDMVVHLAAQAGVRYSLENPKAYAQSNLVGFLNILECCRTFHVGKLMYASSSSIYGMSEKPKLSVSDRVDNPVSLYAATKKSNELMAHAYTHLYNIQTVGLRFFTVYGPWGRPDMAPFIFADAITKGQPIRVFNNGRMMRDFTYVDDVVEALYRLGTITLKEPYNIFNIGNSAPVNLLDFIQCLEAAIGKPAIKKMDALQPGDVIATWADTSELENITGYKPATSIENGVAGFIEWYKSYY